MTTSKIELLSAEYAQAVAEQQRLQAELGRVPRLDPRRPIIIKELEAAVARVRETKERAKSYHARWVAAGLLSPLYVVIASRYPSDLRTIERDALTIADEREQVAIERRARKEAEKAAAAPPPPPQAPPPPARPAPPRPAPRPTPRSSAPSVPEVYVRPRVVTQGAGLAATAMRRP